MIMTIKKTIQSGVKSGSITKAEIAKARNKSQTHSTTQYPSFLAKIDDVENCMSNLGYQIEVTKIE